ncbi:hypothetical protein V8E55_004758 [Tylopilus felleus]
MGWVRSRHSLIKLASSSLLVRVRSLSQSWLPHLSTSACPELVPTTPGHRHLRPVLLSPLAVGETSGREPTNCSIFHASLSYERDEFHFVDVDRCRDGGDGIRGYTVKIRWPIITTW